MRPRRVVIAGIASHWGCDLARRLERDPSIEYLAGIDTERPPVDLERTELIEADLRSPTLSKLLPSTEADTVVHCGIVWYPGPGKPARALHDINVIGTLQLLAACERTEGLQRLVVRGSAAIYGSEPAAPSLFTEEMARTYPLKTRFQRDIGELESYVDNFARRHPELSCCVLRYQPEIGPELDAPLARYLALPVVPTQLGFDPRLQFVHSEDATGALLAALASDVRGPVNVAPGGSISLSRILRLAGRPSVPVPNPLFGPVFSQLGRSLGLADLYSDALRLLRYGRGVDNRRLVTELDFQPRFDAAGAVRDFVRSSQGRRLAAVPHVGDLLERLAGVVPASGGGR